MAPTTERALNATKQSPKTLTEKLCCGIDDQGAVQIERALKVALDAKEEEPIRPKGIDVALILKRLGVDAQTLQAALLSDPRQRDTVELATIEQDFGVVVANLVKNVNWLNTFNVYSQDLISGPEQAETLRRMLLAMVDDVRAVLIKLAFRVQRLRLLSQESADIQQYISKETLDIYAPLANRLGVGQLKWELEDYAFRYLEPSIYKRMAESLAENREKREQYVKDFIEILMDALAKEKISAKIYGRPKHIYSIWRKMQRKQVEFDDLYDLRGIRVTVDKISTCYAVLGLVHGLWKYVPQEFDDYIANSKENGYQSLHTVVVGPNGAMVEIQIRSEAMDSFAELGVAAHWRYKEGGKQDAAVEQSIASIRRLLENDANEALIQDFRAELYSDRIFVLTPKGQVKNMAKGSTPLDFAYAIHTEVGHRCRGAKVNNRIVPLTHTLHSGEQVEILTTKQGVPSRSWIDTNMGYLKTPHAISKVRSWFKQQDHKKNMRNGKTILDKERQRLGVKDLDLDALVKHFHLARLEELLIQVGRAEITPSQLAGALKIPELPADRKSVKRVKTVKPNPYTKESVSIQGVGNLLTTVAQCCKPVPGDSIIGFITLGKGITVHRQECSNILQLPSEKEARLIDVNWGEEPEAFAANIYVKAFDRRNLLRDITEILSNAHINIIKLQTQANADDSFAGMYLTIEVRNTVELSWILSKIGQIRNVFEAKRKI